MKDSYRTEAAKKLLAEIEEWSARTGTPETTVGHVLFRHPGFAGLIRKRLTVSRQKEAQAREFLEQYPDGYSGTLPQTHIGSTEAIRRRCMEKPRNGPVDRVAMTEQEIAIRRVDRDPCVRCGTRGDVWCKHKRGWQ